MFRHTVVMVHKGKVELPDGRRKEKAPLATNNNTITNTTRTPLCAVAASNAHAETPNVHAHVTIVQLATTGP
jgi:hypothetical protein